MPNYLTYPFQTMRITQSYNGTTSHYPHTIGNPKDYPIDEGGTDGGRDWVYCPCDEMIIKRLYGIGNKGTNTVWLESTTKVLFANGKTDYAVLMITHSNDSDLRRLHLGQRFKRGEKVCMEGTDGATGNHVHMSVGAGKFVGNGWKPKTVTVDGKTYTKYVIDTTNGALKPEQAFWIDPNFTKIVNAKGLKFKELPPEPGYYTVKDLVANLYAGTTKGCKITDVLERGVKVKIDHVKLGYNDHYFGKIVGKGWADLTQFKKVK